MQGAEPRAFHYDQASRNESALFLASAALAAGPAVMDVYERGCEVFSKGDGSPVTLADRRAEAVICEFLSLAAPQIPIVAEEAVSQGRRPAVDRRFLLVDPLDGTKEFIAGNGEFTINVAMIECEAPVAGAVYAPALARLWFGGDTAFVCDAPVGRALPDPAEWRPIRVRAAMQAMAAVASRSHLDAKSETFLRRLPITERRSRGSSLKFCLIAEGEADVYPRFGPTMEWDTAAGDAVLRAAGGVVLDPSGSPLTYGKHDEAFRNGPFIAWGDAKAAQRFSFH